MPEFSYKSFIFKAILRITQYEFGLPVLILATGLYQNLRKKNMKGLYTVQDFPHIFSSFLSFGIICNKHMVSFVTNAKELFASYPTFN